MNREPRQTYKIVGHQKVGLVLLGCEAGLLQQGLDVVLEVHPLQGLLHPPLPLGGREESGGQGVV